MPQSVYTIHGFLNQGLPPRIDKHTERKRSVYKLYTKICMWRYNIEKCLFIIYIGIVFQLWIKKIENLYEASLTMWGIQDPQQSLQMFAGMLPNQHHR